MIPFIYKSWSKALNIFRRPLNNLCCKLILKGNNVRHHSFRSNGIPYIMVAMGGSFSIGKNFAMNNGIKANPIGCYDRCTFFVDRGAVLKIGNNVGISQSAIVCQEEITIGNNVKIGGGVKIYDTDFHSLDASLRTSGEDFLHRKKVPVIIRDNAFIGAFSIILKGVTIGENSIIGAGSVVTRSVPDNQIWAGNPAKFIRNI